MAEEAGAPAAEDHPSQPGHPRAECMNTSAHLKHPSEPLPKFQASLKCSCSSFALLPQLLQLWFAPHHLRATFSFWAVRLFPGWGYYDVAVPLLSLLCSRGHAHTHAHKAACTTCTRSGSVLGPGDHILNAVEVADYSLNDCTVLHPISTWSCAFPQNLANTWYCKTF